MDKVMSTRMDETVIQHVAILAKKLGTSKKAVLENAIRCYAENVGAEQDLDILQHTFGSWKRNESPAETVKTVKDTMRKSQERHKR